MQNAYIERLNRTYREDVLDAYLFETLEQIRMLSDEWQHHYNHTYPHEGLHGVKPAEWKSIERQSRFEVLIEQDQQNNNDRQNTQSTLQNNSTNEKSNLAVS